MRDQDFRWRRERPSAGSRLVSLLLMIWLAVGLLAAAQRHYFENTYLDGGQISCAGWGTIAVTAIAGPLNYLGLNPKVGDCELPEPSP